MFYLGSVNCYYNNTYWKPQMSQARTQSTTIHQSQFLLSEVTQDQATSASFTCTWVLFCFFQCRLVFPHTNGFFKVLTEPFCWVSSLVRHHCLLKPQLRNDSRTKMVLVLTFLAGVFNLCPKKYTSTLTSLRRRQMLLSHPQLI